MTVSQGIFKERVSLYGLSVVPTEWLRKIQRNVNVPVEPEVTRVTSDPRVMVTTYYLGPFHLEIVSIKIQN